MTAGDRAAVENHTPRGAEQPTLVQVYRFFCDEVSAWARQAETTERLDEACDGLVRVLRDKLQLVVIDLGPGDNAQVIFESLNDRGTPLLACDLVSTREGLFLRRLDTIDTSVVTPVLLHLFGNYDEDARWPALEALESWLLRRMVCRQTAKNYNRLLLDLLDELTKAHGDPGDVVTSFLLRQSADSAFWPRDDDIRTVFLSQPLYRQFTQARLRVVLEGCDRALHTGYGERLTVNETLSIEHLLPQAWETHWPVVGDGENAQLMESHRREALKHTMGNLTLVTKKLNPVMSNAGWEKKRSDLLQHSALALNRLLPTIWGPDQILQRSLELADAFVSEWSRPPAGVPTPSVEDMLGAAVHDEIAEERGTPGAGLRRRSVALHIIEAFRGLPIGTVLTVSEMCAAETSQYHAKEISAGAVAYRLNSDDVPGIRTVRGSSPLAAEKIGDEIAEVSA